LRGGALAALRGALSAELERDPAGPGVAGLLAAYARERADWRAFARFDRGGYARNLVFKDDLYELLVVCWNPGQESPIHDHAGARCWMTVLEGRIEEVRHERRPAGPSIGPLVERSARTFGRGETAFIRDEIGLHRVRPVGAGPAVSLHLYSPPIATSRVYDPETGAARERVLGYHGVAGALAGGAAVS